MIITGAELSTNWTLICHRLLISLPHSAYHIHWSFQGRPHLKPQLEKLANYDTLLFDTT